MRVEEDIAFIAGAVMSDGSIYIKSNGSYHLELSVKDREFVDEFAERLDNLGFPPQRHQRNDDERYVAQKGCKFLYEMIEKIKNNPEELSRPELKKEFLRAYYSGDGYLRSDLTGLGITTTSEERKEYLLYILEKLDYNFSIYESGAGYSDGSFKLKTNKRLEIKRFVEEIGSPIPRKSKDIELSKGKRQGYKWSDRELNILRSELEKNETGIWSWAKRVEDKFPNRTVYGIRQKAHEVKG